MIPLSEINIAAEKFGVPAEIIEKDYAISWILFCLSQSKIKDDFIFYGGTAIKRIYFEDHRFSEDIDLLSAHKYSLDDILQFLQCLQYARHQTNLLLEVVQDSVFISKGRVQLSVHYSGHEEILGAPKIIRLDFMMDAALFGEIKDKKILKSYSDLKSQKGTLKVMTLNTILANKLGLLEDDTRNEPRDVFDIWFLFNKSNKFKLDKNKLCGTIKEKYGYCPTASTLIAKLHKQSLKQNWHLRLNKQIAHLPDFDTVIKQIIVKLKKALR